MSQNTVAVARVPSVPPLFWKETKKKLLLKINKKKIKDPKPLHCPHKSKMVSKSVHSPMQMLTSSVNERNDDDEEEEIGCTPTANFL
jgi:hypothetical protein